MELKEFIKQALSDIAKAVSESQEELKGVAVVNPPKSDQGHGPMGRVYFYEKHTINFDIAVTASAENEKSGGVRVLSAIAGDVSSTSTNQQSSRITFSIPVYLSKGLPQGLEKHTVDSSSSQSSSCALPTATVEQS